MSKEIFQIKTYSLKNLKRVAYLIAEEIKIPASIILEGDLASGKTTLIRELAYFFRIDKMKVDSPTFTIVNNYSGRIKRSRLNFNHFDLYRIEDTKDLISLPFDYFFKGKYINCFEWGKKFLPTIFEYSERVYIINITADNYLKNEEFRRINLSVVENSDI